MFKLRHLRYIKKALHYDIIQIHVIRLYHSRSLEAQSIPGENTRYIHSKVIYPRKHQNHFKLLSPKQMEFYRDTIDEIQKKKITPHSEMDLSAILGLNSAFNPQFDEKRLKELKKWLQKMPNIKVTQKNNNMDQFLISRDHHIESIDFISNSYPMVTWKNEIYFKTHSKHRASSRNTDNTVHRITELISYYQLHTAFNKHSIEAKMILSRGLNHELGVAYNNLISNNIDQLNINDYHHLLGNLGFNILGYFRNILCADPHKITDLHHDLITKRVVNSNDIKSKYNYDLDIDKYEVLCTFLIEYYALYFVNRNEYANVIYGGMQRLSHLDVMPFLFEMKTLVKIGNLLDYINTYYSRLIYNPKLNRLNEYDNEYYFNIHYNKQQSKNDNKLLKKAYRVYSEKQLENGDCSFSVERCTPDIVLSQPIWINNKAIY